MKLLSALAVGLMLAGPVLAQDNEIGPWTFYQGAQAYAAGDYATALQKFLPLAEQGDAKAQEALGFLYDYGLGVGQDSAEAVKWYRLAAEQGHEMAQATLGMSYFAGLGVPQDFVTAHMWSNISAANGTNIGAITRDEIAAKMTPADITEAQRRARVCLASNYQDCD